MAASSPPRRRRSCALHLEHAPFAFKLLVHIMQSCTATSALSKHLALEFPWIYRQSHFARRGRRSFSRLPAHHTIHVKHRGVSLLYRLLYLANIPCAGILNGNLHMICIASRHLVRHIGIFMNWARHLWAVCVRHLAWAKRAPIRTHTHSNYEWFLAFRFAHFLVSLRVPVCACVARARSLAFSPFAVSLVAHNPWFMILCLAISSW